MGEPYPMSQPTPCPNCGAPTIRVKVSIPGAARQEIVCDGPWPMIKLDQTPYALGPKTGRAIPVFSPHEVSCLGGSRAAPEG